MVLYAEFVVKGVTINLTAADQTWGNREMYDRLGPDEDRRRSREVGVDQHTVRRWTPMLC
jgi:hypothetical protein